MTAIIAHVLCQLSHGTGDARPLRSASNLDATFAERAGVDYGADSVVVPFP